jgi:hypothetical protein
VIRVSSTTPIVNLLILKKKLLFLYFSQLGVKGIVITPFLRMGVEWKNRGMLNGCAFELIIVKWMNL